MGVDEEADDLLELESIPPFLFVDNEEFDSLEDLIPPFLFDEANEDSTTAVIYSIATRSASFQFNKIVKAEGKYFESKNQMKLGYESVLKNINSILLSCANSVEIHGEKKIFIQIAYNSGIVLGMLVSVIGMDTSKVTRIYYS
ncbi:uncharacterized protein LOC113271768 [Papaver somniferum]|uniref:uncharacterized protein LOC113271768 n=1 Tax=Papaver somniferum TaxID=3469 RepID=UPI000E6FD326|nr:uncharacterized protein LOC113271768 [Papaver somniferum]